MPLSVRPLPLPTVEPSHEAVSLLDVEPELASWIAPHERAAARLATRLHVVTRQPGPFEPSAVLAVGRHGFGALIVSGLISREIEINEQPVMRLEGPGEILLEEPPDAGTTELPETWRACVTTRFAILDDTVLVAIRRWPGLARGVFACLQQSHDTTLLQLSISHLPRVEDRILALFRLLASRWGRMTPDGIAVPIALTHEAIGRMVGARRPTVTLALRELALQHHLDRQADGRWLLAKDGGPPETDGQIAARTYRHEAPVRQAKGRGRYALPV